MKIEQYKKDSQDYTKLTSDLARQFAFAGIAIVWIFRIEKPKDHLIPTELFKPLLFLVLALSSDLLQYLIPAIIWTIFYRYHEYKKTSSEADLKASDWLPFPGWVFFFTKIFMLVWAYIYIVTYLIQKL